jgi:hypothetical protein
MGGQTTEGIFRLSAPSRETAAARIQIEVRVQVVDSYALFVTLRFQIDGLDCDEAIQKAQHAVDNCVIAALLLKSWLRELPDSIVPQVIVIVVFAFHVYVFDNFFQKLYSRCIQMASDPAMNQDGITQLLHSLPRANMCTLKVLALFLYELSENSSVTLMGLDNFAIVFAPCWLRNPCDDPKMMLLNTSLEISFVRMALTVLCSKEFVVQEEVPASSPVAVSRFLEMKEYVASPQLIHDDVRVFTSNVTPSKPKGHKLYARRRVIATDSNPVQVVDFAHCVIRTQYLGVALEEQCVCEWSGLRIPAVLGGMLTALSTPVDVMLESLSSAAACDDDAAAVVFAELESLCVGRSGDADVVCEAIVSKRIVHGAGLDVGLLRVWLRRLPDAVSFQFLNGSLVYSSSV